MSNIESTVLRRTALRGALDRVKSAPWLAAGLAGFGGFLTIALLASLNAADILPLLIAPFGASSVLVFGAPQSPFARPRNVIGGHVVAAVMGLVAVSLLGPGPLAMALGVGLAIAAMMVSDTVHPPAGANPIVVALTGVGWSFLAAPVFVGAVAIVAMGLAYRRLAAGRLAR
ncbi:HPP family protein [Hyphomicrobium sp. CS1GBMeth3]|uniref:HPP family protein n=1 Tax=Hyphomicrobium sp. CS1GBMeth3 TaxID=1892845 RepID=UPI0009313672|nr:HPP family protein [Hyphomicrobium sp. CS1GBMeth3]